MRDVCISWALLLLSVPALDACTPAPAPLPISDGCNPLLYDVECGLPYPSDFFLVDDGSMPSGKRIHFGDLARLTTASGLSADLNDAWAADGFSPMTPVVFTFGEAVDPASVAGLFADPEHTLKPGFPTALIEADTGRRIAHFVDVDPRATEVTRQAIVLRPLQRLKARSRYVVAISGVRAIGGSLAAAPEAFARMRDRNTGDDAVLSPLSERFERDVFPVAVGAGITRADLQLAWDFTTASDERPTDDMFHARELALAALEQTPPTITVDTVLEGDALTAHVEASPEITWRIVRGTMTAPRVVDQAEPGALLLRGADGRVVVDGTVTFPFVAVIPASVRDAAAPGIPLLYGHGFFSDRFELEVDATRALVNDARAIAVAIDWQGMSSDDVGEVISAIGGDVFKGMMFTERVVQAMVNWHAVGRALKSGIVGQSAAFQRADGTSVVDVERPLSFVGISQGHILGGTLSALDADIERSVLQVGGADLTAMMFRARPFAQMLFLLNYTLPDPLDQQLFQAHMQTQLDRIDPGSYARYVVGGDVPFGPSSRAASRRVLLQMGIGDAQVPNLATEIHARLLGIPLLEPSPLDVFDVAHASLPADGSGLMVYDLGVDASFNAVAEPAPAPNLVHEALRRTPEARAQIATFLQQGRIINPCTAACVIDASGIPLPEDY